MKKGFTLIELLAVILVLGVIALIAVPIVNKVIEEAKLGAAKVSSQNYLEAVQNYMYEEEISDNLIELEEGKTYYVEKQTKYNISNDSKDVYLNDIIKLSGKSPIDGYVTISESMEAILVFDNYTMKCNNYICEEYKDVVITFDPKNYNDLNNLKVTSNYTYKLTVDVTNADIKDIQWSAVEYDGCNNNQHSPYNFTIDQTGTIKFDDFSWATAGPAVPDSLNCYQPLKIDVTATIGSTSETLSFEVDIDNAIWSSWGGIIG